MAQTETTQESEKVLILMYCTYFYMHTNIVTNLDNTFQCKNRKYNS